jgi:hypothetical protein
MVVSLILSTEKVKTPGNFRQVIAAKILLLLARAFK